LSNSLSVASIISVLIDDIFTEPEISIVSNERLSSFSESSRLGVYIYISVYSAYRTVDRRTECKETVLSRGLPLLYENNILRLRKK